MVQTAAIHGLGGVGKTELALEYAHRYATDYNLAWWVVAEQPTTVVATLVELAGQLGIGEATEPARTIRELFAELRGRDRWLLVFDNAEAPDDLTSHLPPGGGGHVLVTSRHSAWGRLAAPVRLDVLGREEAVAFVRKRTGSDDEAAAAALVEALAGLPLALEEAAAYVEATGIGLEDYLGLVGQRMVELFGLGSAAAAAHADERRVASIWSVSLERVRAETPGTEALLDLCAFLAPDAIPRRLLAERVGVLPAELAEVARDPLRFNEAVQALGRYSLITATPKALGLHRLVQAVIRARLDGPAKQRWAKAAVKLLRHSFPVACWELSTWPTCQQLLPHVLAAVEHAERLDAAGQQAGWLLERASMYLRERGQYQAAKPLARRALNIAEKALGADHLQVGDAHDEFGKVLQALGDYHGARQQYEEALRIAQANEQQQGFELGSRHSQLGTVLRDLGDLVGARAAHQRALEIGEATIGPNDPYMVFRHNNLGSVLRELGDLPSARAEHERALEISEATLGPDHPTMAILRSNLELALQDLSGE